MVDGGGSALIGWPLYPWSRVEWLVSGVSAYQNRYLRTGDVTSLESADVYFSARQHEQ